MLIQFSNLKKILIISSFILLIVYILVPKVHAKNIVLFYDNPNVIILSEQINSLQRALIAYERINPGSEYYPLTLPSIDKLVFAGYLSKSSDISFTNNSYRMFTLWQGEITVESMQHQLVIVVNHLPQRICNQLLYQLRLTSPRSSCQGGPENPMDYLLLIPVSRVKLFT